MCQKNDVKGWFARNGELILFLALLKKNVNVHANFFYVHGLTVKLNNPYVSVLQYFKQKENILSTSTTNKIRLMYEDYLKSFKSQHEVGVTHQKHYIYTQFL